MRTKSIYLLINNKKISSELSFETNLLNFQVRKTDNTIKVNYGTKNKILINFI